MTTGLSMHEVQADLTHKLRLTQNNEHNNHSEFNFMVFINAAIIYNKRKQECS